MEKNLQNLYNTYLRATRSAQNKPYTFRKNFDNFDDSKIMYLHRLDRLFTNYPNVKVELFFKAPYEIYNDGVFDLEYFSSVKALTAYTTYLKKLELLDPDNDYQIQFIKESLSRIGKYCVEHKLKLKDYIHHRVGLTHVWITEYKKRNISVYVLMEFDELLDIMFDYDEETRSFILNNLDETYITFKRKYDSSTRAKKIVKHGINFLNSAL